MFGEVKQFWGVARYVTRDCLKPGEVFYCADEFSISWHPTLRSLWSPRGQQVMISTPMQPIRRYGLGAVNWHGGETLVIKRRHKRRREVAELLEALLQRHRHERIYVAWDNASTHQDEEIEAVMRRAAGRLILLSLPTYSPGSTRLRCCGGTSDARSLTANCSAASRRFWKLRKTFSTATTAGRMGCDPSSGLHTSHTSYELVLRSA